MGRRTLLLIASILVAALGTALIWLYVQGADNRAQQDTSLTRVLVTNGSAVPGLPAERVPVKAELVPTSLAAGALTSLQQVAGQQLINGVVPNQILQSTMFSTQGQAGIADKNAFVTINITDPHRVPALLKAGDRVAIYAITTKGNSGLTKIMAEATVKTLGADTVSGPTGATVPTNFVGFEVSPEDAVQLMRIETYGNPVLTLLGKDATGADVLP